MKKNISIFLLILLTITIWPQENNLSFDGVFTTLVIVEETENGTSPQEERPLSDGIFNTLWDLNDYIFFDMIPESPITFIDKQLDVKPFFNTARGAGADSVLLIKLDYTIEELDQNIHLKIDQYHYHLYSLNQLKSVREGEIPLKYDKIIEKKDKTKVLNKIGAELMKTIYQ